MKNKFKYYLSAIYKSFFSREFYHDLVKRKNIYGFQYLLLLALLTSIPFAIEIKSIILDFVGLRDVPSINEEYLAQNTDYINQQVPKIFIKNNQFFSDAAEPKEVYAKSGKLVAIIDMEDKIKEIDFYDNIIILKPANASVIISGVLIKIPTLEFISSFQDYFSMDKESGQKKFFVNKFLEDYNVLAVMPTAMITVICAGWFFIRYIVSALLFSVFAGIIFFALFKKYNADFRSLVRIAAFTSTPVILVEFLSLSAKYSFFSSPNIVYLIIHILYIHFAIESYKKLDIKKL